MAARTQKRCIELVRTQPPRRVEPMRQVGIVGERVQQALDIVAVGAPDRATLHVSRVHVAAGWDRRGHVEMWAWQVANGCGEQGCQGRWGAYALDIPTKSELIGPQLFISYLPLGTGCVLQLGCGRAVCAAELTRRSSSQRLASYPAHTRGVEDVNSGAGGR